MLSASDHDDAHSQFWLVNMGLPCHSIDLSASRGTALTAIACDPSLTPPTFPHTFPSLRSGTVPSILIVGAGLSAGLAPGPAELLRLSGKKAEEGLGIDTGLLEGEAPCSASLYSWADSVLDLIDGKCEIPKLALATALGLRNNPAFSRINNRIPAEPRHRVIARFAREAQWEKVFSYNWDCRIEHAFERAGFRQGSLSPGEPWPHDYCVIITNADLPHSASGKTIPIHKLHGCAVDLDCALELHELRKTTDAKLKSDRFMIGESELKQNVASDTGQAALYADLTSCLNTKNVVVAGWSVSDKYIRDYLDRTCKEAIKTQSRREDVLTCIDIEVGDGHVWLAALFSRQPESFMALVEKVGWTQNDFFEWVWAIYALDYLILAVPDAENTPILEQVLRLQSAPTSSIAVISFLHNFLPEWNRLCWRQGLVPFSVNGAHGDWSTLLLEAEEEEVPLNLPGRDYSDLRAIGRLLVRLLDHDRLNEYDYERHKGAFWKGDTLIVLLPIGSGSLTCELRADGPLKARWAEACNYATEIVLCAVPFDTAVTLDVAARDSLADRFISAVSLPRLGKPDALRVETLEELFP